MVTLTIFIFVSRNISYHHCSVTMKRRNQNGTNNDIISAINKLNDGLSSNRGDVYNFGDFTYDDGSNISDAVQTLVRAARVGRRL